MSNKKPPTSKDKKLIEGILLFYHSAPTSQIVSGLFFELLFGMIYPLKKSLN